MHWAVHVYGLGSRPSCAPPPVLCRTQAASRHRARAGRPRGVPPRTRSGTGRRRVRPVRPDRADRAVPDVEAPGLAPTLRQTPTARTAPGSAVRGLPQVPGRSMAGTSRFGRAWGGTPTPPPWIAANRPWGLLERAGKPHGGAGMFRWAIWTLSSPGDVEVACSGRVRKSGVGDRAGRGQSLVRGRYRRTAQAPAAVIGIQRGTYRWAWLDERC